MDEVTCPGCNWIYLRRDAVNAYGRGPGCPDCGEPTRPPYLLHTPTGAHPAPTPEAAAILLLRAGKADPGVTCMPYVTRADGSPPDADEEEAVDRAMDAADYDALEPL